MFVKGYRGTEGFRIRSRIKITGLCWLWIGQLSDEGYAVLRVDGKNWRVHKLIWERVNGLVPVGLELDHVCRNRNCIRPSHCEAVTHLENMRRSPVKFPPRCKNGHLFDELNTYRPERGGRVCRACDKVRTLARYHARKGVR